MIFLTNQSIFIRFVLFFSGNFISVNQFRCIDFYPILEKINPVFPTLMQRDAKLKYTICTTTRSNFGM